MEIDICIDVLADCLICSETGEECTTEYCRVHRTITEDEALCLNMQGWRFDWSIPQQNGYDVYELRLKGSDETQGMIALKHIKEQGYTEVYIVEAAPSNIGCEGKYKGVGAHLFAIACKLSWNEGNKGHVQFTAKGSLVAHYKKTLNAKSIDWNIMYIDSRSSRILLEKYFKEGY